MSLGLCAAIVSHSLCDLRSGGAIAVTMQRTSDVTAALLACFRCRLPTSALRGDAQPERECTNERRAAPQEETHLSRMRSKSSSVNSAAFLGKLQIRLDVEPV